MAALLRWHGAEELEHRSVAFDVLTNVVRGAIAYGNPAFRPGDTPLPRAYERWVVLQS